MNIYPAIDIYEGKAVRLKRGDYQEVTVYSDDPVSLAASFRAQGASCLHVVDLEGARTGDMPAFEIIARIVRESGLFTQVGGGIRTEEAAARYLEAGVSRVILGTAALEEPALVERLTANYGNRVAAGVDVRDGFVAVRGWMEQTGTRLSDLLTALQKSGVGTAIVTDISRDGMLSGANQSLYREITHSANMGLIASGGVSTVPEIRTLKAMGLTGAIVGKALYEGKITISQALEAAK